MDAVDLRVRFAAPDLITDLHKLLGLRRDVRTDVVRDHLDRAIFAQSQNRFRLAKDRDDQGRSQKEMLGFLHLGHGKMAEFTAR